MNGEWKTFGDIRRQLYKNIVDETLFVARASEGAVSADWLMTQPIFIRREKVKELSDELKEREKLLNNLSKGKGSGKK